MLTFLERPKMISKMILKSIKWKNGNLFENHQNTLLYILPADLLQKIRREMINMVGIKIAQNLLYDLNQLSADLIIADAEDMKFEGFEKIRYFCSIMALFGWGDCSDFHYDHETKTGSVILKDFPKLENPTNQVVHYDFCGITARIIKIVYNDVVVVEETQCAATGAAFCKFIIKPDTAHSQRMSTDLHLQNFPTYDASDLDDVKKFLQFRDNIKMVDPGILRYENRNRIVIKDVISINSMINANFKNLGRKMVGGLLYRCAKDVKMPFSTGATTFEEIQEILDKCSLMGWGNFEITSDGEDFKVKLMNSPFTRGFPKGDVPVCFIAGGLLHQIFQNYYDTPKILIKETSCEALGDPFCLFEIRKI